MSDVDQAAFRRAAGQFAGGIVVVTTSGGHAMTVSAFASVSLEPPLVLFCAEKIARFHDAVLEAGAWAVSILAEDGEKTARWLATRGRPLEGQLDEVPHHLAPVTGAPVLDSALAALECETFAVYDGGDHSIIVGRVTAVDGPADPSPRDVAPAPADPSPSGAAPGPADPSPRGAAPGPADPSPSGAAPGPPARGPLIHHAGRYRRLRPAED